VSQWPVQLSELQAIARGERCSDRVLYPAILVGFFAAIGFMFLTRSALWGVLGGSAVYFCIVCAGSAKQ
jgi:hypothetical protein